MKQLVFIITLLFLTNSLLISQEIVWGPEYKKKGSYLAIYSLVGNGDSHYYLNMRPKKNGGVLFKYDYKHQLIEEKDINLAYDGETLIPKDFLKMSNKVFAFIPTYTRKTKELNLFFSEFKDGEFGEVEKAYTQKLEQEYNAWSAPSDFSHKKYKIGYNSLFNRTDLSAVEIIISDNKKYAAFSCGMPNIDKNIVILFDENMNILWEKELDTKGESAFFSKQTLVSNNGEVILFGRTTFNDEVTYKAVTVTENDFTENDVKLGGGKHINEIGVFEKNGIYVAGFYRNEDKGKFVDGFFFGSLGEESDNIETVTHQFKKYFLQKIMPERTVKKGKGLTIDFNINEFIAHADGTFSFLAEKEYTSNKRVNQGSDWKDVTIFHTDEIIIPRFRADGSLINTVIIEKNAGASSYFATLSYIYHVYNNKIYLVFNDKKNQRGAKGNKS
ncbi:MAG: hypothetical protein ACI94Y_003163 [Maribacter sp.]|jgi:hypothetical protein